MLIIVEGVDGAGKTTLVRRLQAAIRPEPVQLMKRGPLLESPVKEYVDALQDYLPGRGMNIITDRWHVGEMIYGPMYRGRSRITPTLRKFIEMYLQELGALRLIVTEPYETIVKRLEWRGEDFLQMGHVRAVMEFFEQYADDEHYLKITSQQADPAALVDMARKLEHDRDVYWSGRSI